MFSLVRDPHCGLPVPGCTTTGEGVNREVKSQMIDLEANSSWGAEVVLSLVQKGEGMQNPFV